MGFNDYERDETPPDGDKPLKKNQFPPQPLLPHREWLEGIIVDGKYQYVRFNGKIQYVTNKDTKENILDADDKPIPRTEFMFTIDLKHYEMKGGGKLEGQPRKVWLRLGASLGKNAQLP